jgi:hypothetical protein
MGICQQCAKEEKEGMGPWWIWPVLLPAAAAVMILIGIAQLLPEKKR